MDEREKALNEAADYAEFYAEERMRLCQDSILHDPILRGFRGPNAIAASQEMQVEGTINSASYHAAMNIVEHLRALARRRSNPVERS